MCNVHACDEQHLLRRELRAKADEEGVHPVFKQGSYDILRVTHRALLRLSAYMDLEKPRTLEGCIRNYILNYRPDYETGKLVKAVEQPWAKGFEEGSHRIKRSWADHLYEWLDEHGVRASKGSGPLRAVGLYGAVRPCVSWFS